MIKVSTFSSFFELFAGLNFGAAAIFAFIENYVVKMISDRMKERLSEKELKMSGVSSQLAQYLEITPRGSKNFFTKLIKLILRDYLLTRCVARAERIYNKLSDNYYYQSLRQVYWPKFLFSGLFCVIVLIGGSIQESNECYNNTIFHFIVWLSFIALAGHLWKLTSKKRYSLIRSTFLVFVSTLIIVLLSSFGAYATQDYNLLGCKGVIIRQILVVATCLFIAVMPILFLFGGMLIKYTVFNVYYILSKWLNKSYLSKEINDLIVSEKKD